MNDLILKQAILENVCLLALKQQQTVLDFAESAPAPQPAHPEPTADVAKTPLGKRLWELRQQAIAAGMKLLTTEEIEQEMAEQRDRRRDLYEPLA